MPKLPDDNADYIFKLNVVNKTNDKSIWIPLPISDFKLRKLLEAIDVDDMNQCEIIENRITVSGLPDHLFQHYDINSLNTLAYKISNILPNGEYPKYKALLEAFAIGGIENAIELIDSLDDYEFYLEATTPEDYGREIFFKTYNINPNDPAINHIQFGKYGMALMIENNAVKTEYGFICKNDDLRQEQKQNDAISQGIGGIS